MIKSIDNDARLLGFRIFSRPSENRDESIWRRIGENGRRYTFLQVCNEVDENWEEIRRIKRENYAAEQRELKRLK